MMTIVAQMLAGMPFLKKSAGSRYRSPRSFSWLILDARGLSAIVGGSGGDDARLEIRETADGETHARGGDESGRHDEQRWVGDFHARPEARGDGHEKHGRDAAGWYN